MPRWEWVEDELLPAERRVVEALRNGDWDDEGFINVGEDEGGGALPEAGDDSRKLTAEVVKALALGRAPEVPLPDTGLRLLRGWIAGRLSLEGVTATRDLGLVACRFDAAPVLRSASLRSLFLNRSELPGLKADRLDASGSVVLRDATVRGEARLLGGKIGGNLSCIRARFERKGGDALNADGLDTRGNVFLSNATVRGEARLLRAKIGADIACEGATFEREGGDALDLSGAEVDGTFFLRPSEDGAVVRITGRLVLIAASLGSINDAESCWPKAGELILDRCRYGAFTAGPVTAEARLRWLALQDPAQVGEDFWPQPYEQLAKVLREMGHQDDAREVLATKERLQRKARRDSLKAELNGMRLRERVETARRAERAAVNTEVLKALSAWPTVGHPDRARLVAQLAPIRRSDWDQKTLRFDLSADPASPRVDRLSGARAAAAFRIWRIGLWDGLVHHVIRSGHRPERAFLFLLGFWALGVVMFGSAAFSDAIKPNNAFVLRADEWVACHPDHALGAPVFDDALNIATVGRNEGTSQRDCFEAQPEAREFPRFNALVYSVDTLLPIVDMEMQGNWIPDESKGGVGVVARLYLWLHIALGWALSLLAVAGFSGLVKSD